jgi:hypothetical protein
MNARHASLCLIGILLSTGAAHAQTGLVPFGGSLLLPNYERIPVGEREALEAGAYVARTRDGNANWYNPAGLALTDRTSINTSASAYEGTSVQFRSFEVKTNAFRISALGGFFGVAVAEPLTNSPNVRYGLYIARPLSWDSGTIDANAPIDAERRLSLLSIATLARTEPGIAMAFRANPRLRMGGALGVSYTSIDETQDIGVRRVDADSANTIRRTIAVGGTVYHAVFRAGMQWDANELLRVGVVATTPGLQIMGGTKFDYTFGSFGPSGYVDETLRDTEADFDLRLPYNIGLGVAAIFDRAEVEVSVRHYGASEPYDLMATSVAGRRVESIGGAPPTTTSFTVNPVPGEWRSVTNVAVGGNLSFGEMVRVHLGFQTDQSPVPRAGDMLFRQVNLVSGTAGLSFTGEHFGGTIGLGYSTGESDPVQSSSPTEPVETTLRVSSIRVIYSLAARF